MTDTHPLLAWMAGLVLTAALLLGGGTMQGLPGDAIVIALGLLLGVLLVWVWPMAALTAYRVELLLLAGMLVLPLLQLMPLPPVLWTHLAGRATLAADQASVGIGAHWAPLSLDPAGTWRAWYALLPGAALFVAALTLPSRVMERLVTLVIGIAVASTVLGFAQLAGGPHSALRPFAITDSTDAVGLFANRNHFASLLYCALALACGALIKGWIDVFRDRETRWLTHLYRGVAVAILILGLTIADSRAGIVLGMGVVIGALCMVLRAPILRRGALHGFGLVLLIAFVVSIQFGLYAVMARFQQDPFDDARVWIYQATLHAARHYGLLGSGIGSFVHALPQFQTHATLIPQYVNHAHNDWLELWLEAGLPFAILAALVVAWLLRCGGRVWRRSLAPSGAILRARAASIGLLAVLLHSAVDYPLRPLANEAVFALLVALLVRGAAITDIPDSADIRTAGAMA